jgi:hypothetical protein
MRSFHPAVAIILIAVCCPPLFAEKHLLHYDEDDFTYELTFDDTRISVAQMREIACLSPWSSYCAPFVISSESKRNGKAENVEKSNLREGAKQIEIFRNRQVPQALASIKATLLATFERSLEKQQARYAYLKSGDMSSMRAILCGACKGRAEESALLEQLRTATDPHRRLNLSWYDWQNKLVACEHAHPPSPYPLDQWQHFLNDYGITEKRRSLRID